MPAYNKEQTKARIFDAAIDEFAANGIAGARVDRIAEMAESNKALIYSYFGNKEELFAQVLQKRLTDLAEAVELRPDAVPDYIGELFDFMVANPDVLRLVQHETAHFPPSAAPHREERAAHYADKVTAVATAQDAGSIDPGLDPRFIVLSLIGLVSWFVAAPQITEMVLAREVDPEVLAAYRAHLIEMATRMLRVR
ncbi:TetR family transcriptional regulator [Cnuibacter sp. UC19_7]|uniref:TetR family transcriptional regulator n=1 Tax=Cnuibacter sp. UC19_7 TaxID=3350166 RepID=UPI00366F1207